MIDIDRSGDIPVIKLDLGPFSVTETMLDAIGIDLLELVREIERPVVILDLSPTHHLGSKAIGVLLDAWKTIRQRKGRIAICELNAYSREILRTMRLDLHWEIYRTKAEAAKALSASSVR